MVPYAALATVVIVVATLTGWGIVSTPAPSPSSVAPVTRPSAVAVGPVGSVGSPQPTVPLPADDGSGLPTVHVADDNEAFAALEVGADRPPCPMWRGFGEGSTVTADQVNEALGDVTEPKGSYTVADATGRRQPIWVGRDLDDAARGFGGSEVALVAEATDTAWTAIPDADAWTAIRIERVLELAPGRTAWQIRERASPATYCDPGTPAPRATDVVEVPASADPGARLLAFAGWSLCRTWQRMETTPEPAAVEIDAVADAEGQRPGLSHWLVVDVPGTTARRPVQLWVGDDAEAAGRAHGSGLVVVAGAGDARRAWMTEWLDGRPLAVAFDVVRTPGGRTAWLPTNSAAGVTGDCDVAALDPAVSPDGGDGTAVGDATTPAVEILRGGDTALDMLIDRLAWTGCSVSISDPYVPELAGAAIDDAADQARIEQGRLLVAQPGGSGPVEVFLGTDIVALARFAGMNVVAIDQSPRVWLADETRADGWLVQRTPAGRTAWVPNQGRIAPDRCAGGTGVTPGPIGIRSVTCWIEREPCLAAVATARGLAPSASALSAFAPDRDVAAGAPTDCPPGARCPSARPDWPITVTSVPATWRSADEARVFIVATVPASPAAIELPIGSVTSDMLAVASRPALALGINSDEESLAACPASGIEGRLRGSPWDPRVAWLGNDSLRWPPGTTVRFVPDVVVVAADGRTYRAGDLVQASGTAAGDGRFDACRLTRVESASPLPSAP